MMPNEGCLLTLGGLLDVCSTLPSSLFPWVLDMWEIRTLKDPKGPDVNNLKLTPSPVAVLLLGLSAPPPPFPGALHLF